MILEVLRVRYLSALNALENRSGPMTASAQHMYEAERADLVRALEAIGVKAIVSCVSDEFGERLTWSTSPPTLERPRRDPNAELEIGCRFHFPPFSEGDQS